MANLTRFDPFHLRRLDPFEDMVRGLVPTSLRSVMRWQEPAIPVEVQELDNAYLVTAELPSVKKEDIDISIAGNQITISAEAKQAKMVENAKEWCNERSFGKFSRTVQLPLEIEENGADASYADGLLHLALPKKPSSMTKRLEIH